MIRHSIIIAHRNREASLIQCLDSLANSSGKCKIFLVNNGPLPRLPKRFLSLDMVCIDDEHRSMPIFNKAQLLNHGMTAALKLLTNPGSELMDIPSAADVVTILDADAIVGRDFLRVAEETNWDEIWRVGYRVRKGAADGPLAFEAWGSPLANRPDRAGEPDKYAGWGNSQFTIHRKHLGDLRFNESYVGRGFEDLDFNCRLAQKFIKTPGWKPSRCRLETAPERSMYHLANEAPSPDWHTMELELANHQRFVEKGFRFTSEGELKP